MSLSGYVYVRVENVGVEGGKSERWIVPWPGLLDDGGKGEEWGMLGVKHCWKWKIAHRVSSLLADSS